MFLLVVVGIIVWRLWEGSPLEKLLLTAVASPVALYLLHLCGVPLPVGAAWNPPAAGLLGLVLALGLYRAAQGELRLTARSLWNVDLILTWGLFLLALALWENAYRKSFVLPAHDPVAVPTLGRLIASEGSLAERFQRGDAAAAYPPGFPALMALIYPLFDSRDFVCVFKHLNLLVIAAIPVVWASFCRKLFFPALRSGWLLTFAFYVGFYCIDRTLNFAMPFAGKNSQLLCGLFLPFVAYLFVRAPQSLRGFAGALVAALGLLLIHYSGLYMLFALGAAHLIVHWGEQSRRSVGTYAVLAGSVLALFVPVVWLVKAQGVELASGRADYPAALRNAQEFLLARDSSLFFIFTGLGFHWPYKQLALLLGAAAVMVAAAWFERRQRPKGSDASSDSTLETLLRSREVVLMMLAIVGFGLVLAAGFVPRSGINADYVRWFLFFFFACLAAVVVFAALTAMSSLTVGMPFAARVGGLLMFGALSSYFFARDHREVRKVVADQRVRREEMYEMDAVLVRLAGGRDCLLVTESSTYFDGRAVQHYKPLEYAELVSGCRVVNGSWLRKAAPAWREVSNMPSSAALSGLPRSSALILVATPEQAVRYQEALAGFRLEATGLSIGPFPTWAMKPSTTDELSQRKLDLQPSKPE